MNNTNTPSNQREIALKKTQTARSNLLLMLAFTVVNIGLFLFGSDTVMLFSATIPYYAVVFGFYSVEGVSTYLIVGIAVAAVILLIYLLCFLLSKKNCGWMILALVLFVIDTAALVLLYIWAEDISGILDGLMHIWIIYYLIVGIKYGRQLKTLPEEESTEDNEELPPVESRPIRRADTDVKFRTLIEGDFEGRHIEFRRVKRVNELVIDGYVYDEAEMLVEIPHELKAYLNGKNFAVGMSNNSFSYIAVDGEQVAKKLRLI